MQTIYMVIGDAGDGSNFIEWHRTMSDEKYAAMEYEDRYQSGDGVQITKFKFPVDFDIDAWAKVNYITFAED